MTSATNQDAYGNAGWGPMGYGGRPPGDGNAPWGGGNGGPGWGPGPGWTPYGIHPFWLFKPFGVAAMVLGFIFFWPVGLAILFFMLGARRMMRYKQWRGMNGFQPGWGGGPGFGGFKAWMCGSGPSTPPSSGNRAFDEYRTETLRRLEEEQKEFGDFLDRLRFARDKSEFDQFMADRRSRPPAPPEPGEQPAA